MGKKQRVKMKSFVLIGEWKQGDADADELEALPHAHIRTAHGQSA